MATKASLRVDNWACEVGCEFGPSDDDNVEHK